ncbi:TIGR01459 family HAD-type hydrolase [Sphingomonas sp. ASV193]|uniref:TIGR01459 family HAD-type hydrolase n=1 Tax=Sphingomonas sp. ASV193 TaxID=3144405 RepID=UPI0032E90013
MTDLDALDPRYTTILCDIWGVIHDGHALYPGAAARLARWRGEGRRIVLVTNAPRPAEVVAAQLARLGLADDCWDGISTSGEAGLAALLALSAPPGLLGTRRDRADLETRGLAFADKGFTDLAVTGLDDARPSVADYTGQLEAWARQGVRFHCLNPDRVVIHGGVAEPCAGALADVYEALGGRVAWYGKPHDAIYHHALGLAGDPPRDTVLAVGDSLVTDMLGAAGQGIDALFVRSGIHAGEPWPDDFADRHGLGDWHPIALVDGLA